MENTKRIVVLGGGYAGVEAMKYLNKRYKRNGNLELTLIDRNHYHTLMTELHEVAGSRVEPDAVQISFRRIFGGTKVQVITDTITHIDFANKRVVSDVAKYRYDYLLVTAGGDPEFFGIEGVQKNSFTLWSFEDAMRIREHVEKCFRRAACEPDADKRRKMLTFAVAGAGFTGVELAGELLERRAVLCRKYHIQEREVRVIIVEALNKVLPILSDKLRGKAHRRLERMGAEIMLNSPIFKAVKGSFTIEGGKKIEADTLVWTCGIHGSELTANLGLTMGQESRGQCSFASAEEGIHGMCGCHFDEEEEYLVGKRGRILVNEHMQSVDHPNVYLAGEIIWFVENERVLPQIVETAVQTAHTASRNIAAEVEGRPKHGFKSNYHGFMVSIGSKYAVSNAGGMEISGFFAIALKHLINLHYLFGIAGVNAVWGYLQHEFFNMKDGRSVMASHAAAKIPTYWAVPLRVFLGVKWLIEGVKKVGQGWFNPGPGGLFNVDINAIRIPGVRFGDVTAAATPADAAAGATPADAAAGATPYAADAVGAATGQGGSATWAEPLVPTDSFIYSIYEWFAETVISIHPTIAFLLQVGVVAAEIAIGLGLIFGLFTFLASGASILLGLMFIMSAMGGPEILWYIGAAIVMLGGAGRGFGLDHWVMPVIHDWWNRRTISKKTHLYVGEPLL